MNFVDMDYKKYQHSLDDCFMLTHMSLWHVRDETSKFLEDKAGFEIERYYVSPSMAVFMMNQTNWSNVTDPGSSTTEAICLGIPVHILNDFDENQNMKNLLRYGVIDRPQLLGHLVVATFNKQTNTGMAFSFAGQLHEWRDRV